MFPKNQNFMNFRQQLRERGVEIRWLWSGKRNSETRYDDIAFAIFWGAPSVRTAIVVNYDDEGFGLFVDNFNGAVDEAVEWIAGTGQARAAPGSDPGGSAQDRPL